MIQKLQHMFDILRILYHKIQFHIELTADQLRKQKYEKSEKQYINMR